MNINLDDVKKVAVEVKKNVTAEQISQATGGKVSADMAQKGLDMIPDDQEQPVQDAQDQQPDQQ